jgi:hypothetical protein
MCGGRDDLDVEDVRRQTHGGALPESRGPDEKCVCIRLPQDPSHATDVLECAFKEYKISGNPEYR